MHKNNKKEETMALSTFIFKKDFEGIGVKFAAGDQIQAAEFSPAQTLVKIGAKLTFIPHSYLVKASAEQQNAA